MDLIEKQNNKSYTKNIPALRFPEFQNNGEWEVKRLGEIAEIKTGYPFDSSSFSDDGEYLVVTNGNIQDYSEKVIDNVGNRINVTDNTILNQYLLNLDDILVTMDGTVGRCAKVRSEKLILAQRVARIIAKDVDKEFLYQILRSGNFSKRMIYLSHGGTIKHISLKEISDFYVCVPPLAEQQCIVSVLSEIDAMLSSANEKLEHLKAYKKGLLQKLFPAKGKTLPEFRFKEFEKDGEWEVKKLGDVIVVNSGKDYKHLNHGSIPVFGTGGYMLSVDDKLSDVDAVGIGRKGTIDKPQYLNAPFWTVDTLFFLTEIGGNDIRFIYYLAQTIPWKKYGEQTGVPSLSKLSIENLEVVVPANISEQNKIAQALLSLDKEIGSLSKKRESIENYKNGLMRKLFTN